MNVSAYLFKDGYDTIVDNVKLVDRGGGVRDLARARDADADARRGCTATRRDCIRAVVRLRSRARRSGDAASRSIARAVGAHAAARRRCRPG